ncbi:uncharacterized protein DNG_06855 [Cephalotrichum gorgonifer]|uniref:Uncharacterized protein n=1 Tax=Cephalotrichum gorgonifer TaxID=2041049 RepID=A0AAE8SXP9_9PEZI|nr:uncharacterized protein DNG_06855 [Cephalotrichum gorgonifer]
MDRYLLKKKSSSTKTPLATLSERKGSGLLSVDTSTSTVAIEYDKETPSTEFAGVKELLDKIQEIRNGGGGELCVKHVTPADFSRIIKARSEDDKYRLFFSAAHRLLIVTVPSHPHERATAMIDCRINDATRDMGLRSEIWNERSATFTNTTEHPYAGSSEGDATFTPVLPNRDVRTWPSLVVEVGYTESMAHLRTKADWWLVTSGFEVKVVLLVKLNAPHGHIRIETWKGVSDERPGATMTRVHETASCHPDCIHTVTVSRRPGVSSNDNARVDPNSYTVASGTLRVGFAELFLREPRSGEYDIVFDEEFLKDLAARTWR